MDSALLDRSADVRSNAAPDLQSNPAPDVEQDIGPSPRRDAASDRPTPHVSEGGTIAVEANSFIEDVSIRSAKEVARLITTLQGVREFLQSES